MTTDDTYYERGINLRHGFLTEYYVDAPEYIVKVPQGLKEVGVLLEPVTVVEKGIAQAYEIQRRLRVWRPRKAAVMGAGTIGLLAALVLRLRGLEVTVFGRTAAPYLNSDLVHYLGAPYLSTATTPILDGARQYGPFDLIFNDIDKHGYPASLPIIKEKLRPGGVLIIDNMLWHGAIFDESDTSDNTRGVHEVTRRIFQDKDFAASLIPIRDGLITAVKLR